MRIGVRAQGATQRASVAAERRRASQLCECEYVIPSLILVGLVFGRWWRTTVAISSVGWPVLLVVTNVMDLTPNLLGASALAVINVGVGVLVHQAVLAVLRHARPAH